MKISALTFLAFQINAAVDKGSNDDVTIDIVRREIQAGTIFAYLATKLEADIDLSIYDAAMQAELLAEWRDIEAAINVRRKFGIARGGLTLLIAFLLEGIQRRASGVA